MNKRPQTQYDHVTQQIAAIRPLARLAGVFLPRVRSQWSELERQVAKVNRNLMNADLFAKRYSPLGWSNYDRMSIEVLNQLRQVSVEEGEVILTEYHLAPTTLKMLSHRFSSKDFEPWRLLYQRATERCEANDWLSAVPLLLIIIDGICTATTGKSAFSGGADSDVFDCMASNEGGLGAGLRVLGATRRKLSAEPIHTPFRHGIVHGLNPNFDSPIVAAKALSFVQATIDYFTYFKDESTRLAQAQREQTPPRWRELIAQLQHNAEVRQALEAWAPRAPQVLNFGRQDDKTTLMPGSPELFAVKYLELLSKGNYGNVAAMTVDYPNRPTSARAGRLREELQDLKLKDWSVVSVHDRSAAMSYVVVRTQIVVGEHEQAMSSELRLLYSDENFEAMLRGTAGGTWYVMPNYITDLGVRRLRLSGQ